jgi:hypothetical protein
VPDLSAEHQRRLFEESGLSPTVVEARGYHTLTSGEAAVKVADGDFPDRWFKEVTGGLAIPVYRPDGEFHGEMVRLSKAVKSNKSSRKYVLPVGKRNTLDVNPLVQSLVADPSVPLVFTEGIIKADAILSKALAENIAVCVVAISGAYGWLASVDDEGSTACPDFRDLALGGRQIITISDSDFQVNKNVRAGWTELTAYLASKAGESKASLVVVPMDGLAKQGADDYLLHNTLADLLSLARSPERARAAGGLHFEVLSGKELYDLATDEIPWIVQGAMPRPSITVFAGHTETMKTWHMLRLMIDLTLGRPYLGHPALLTEPTKVMMVNKEMGRAMMGVRLRHLLHGEEYAAIEGLQELIDERMFFADDARIDLNDSTAADALIEMLEVHEPELVGLDSLSMVWTGDENSASEVGNFYRLLREISQRTGASFVIIHHLTKPQQGKESTNPIHQVRGSGQIVQQADSAFTLTHRDKDDLGTTITVHHSKSRAAQHLPTFLTRVANVDGAVEIKFAGLLKDVKAEEYGAKNADREALGEYVLHVLDEQSAMHRAGLRMPMLLKLLGASWPPLKASERPSEATFRRTLKELTAEGRLELKEKSRGHGDLLRLVPDEEEDGEVG